MKKIILGIILGAICSLGFTSTASAANCSGANIGPIVYNGYWYFQAQLTGCTGTSGASLMGYTNGNYTHIQQVNNGVIHNTASLTTSYLSGSSTYTWNGPYFNIWGSGCGAPPFQVAKRFGWRIRNAVGGTWGPWHQAGTAYQMLC